MKHCPICNSKSVDKKMRFNWIERTAYQCENCGNNFHDCRHCSGTGHRLDVEEKVYHCEECDGTGLVLVKE